MTNIITENDIEEAIKFGYIIEDNHHDFCVPIEYDVKRRIVWGTWYSDSNLTVPVYDNYVTKNTHINNIIKIIINDDMNVDYLLKKMGYKI